MREPEIRMRRGTPHYPRKDCNCRFCMAHRERRKKLGLEPEV